MEWAQSIRARLMAEWTTKLARDELFDFSTLVWFASSDENKQFSELDRSECNRMDWFTMQWWNVQVDKISSLDGSMATDRTLTYLLMFIVDSLFNSIIDVIPFWNVHTAFPQPLRSGFFRRCRLRRGKSRNSINFPLSFIGAIFNLEIKWEQGNWPLLKAIGGINQYGREWLPRPLTVSGTERTYVLNSPAF